MAIQVSQHEKDLKFIYWFKNKVHELYGQKNCPFGEEFLSLSRGPIQYVRSYSGYVTKGFRFHTSQRSKGQRTQNSGVLVVRNSGEKQVSIDYYGVLTDIVMLEYLVGNYIVFFRCDWFDVFDPRKGINVDKFGFVSVDTQRRLKTNEPFVLASQASQVFYATDIVKKGNWRIVLKTQPRDAYLVQIEDDEDCLEDAYQEKQSASLDFVVNASIRDEIIDLDEASKEPEIVDIPESIKKGTRKSRD